MFFTFINQSMFSTRHSMYTFLLWDCSSKHAIHLLLLRPPLSNLRTHCCTTSQRICQSCSRMLMSFESICTCDSALCNCASLSSSVALSGACDDQSGSDALQRPAAGTSLNRFFCFCLFVYCPCRTMCCDCRAREQDGNRGGSVLRYAK